MVGILEIWCNGIIGRLLVPPKDEIEMVFLLASVSGAIVEIVHISGSENLRPALRDSLAQLSSMVISSITNNVGSVRCTVCESVFMVSDPVLFIICILNQLRITPDAVGCESA